VELEELAERTEPMDPWEMAEDVALDWVDAYEV